MLVKEVWFSSGSPHRPPPESYLPILGTRAPPPTVMATNSVPRCGFVLVWGGGQAHHPLLTALPLYIGACLQSITVCVFLFPQTGIEF